MPMTAEERAAYNKSYNEKLRAKKRAAAIEPPKRCSRCNVKLAQTAFALNRWGTLNKVCISCQEERKAEKARAKARAEAARATAIAPPPPPKGLTSWELLCHDCRPDWPHLSPYYGGRRP